MSSIVPFAACLDAKSKFECVQCVVAQVCNGKGRYLTLSRLSGAAISLCGVEVFPVAANAASSKQASGSGGSGAFLVTDGADTVSRALSQTAYGVVSSLSSSNQAESCS
jgi:hypothetical protein